MTIAFATGVRNARADAITTFAGNAAFLRIYDGTRPASPATAVSTQVLLAELVCGTPFAPVSSGGVLTLGSITQDASANNSGTASWFRLVKADGTTVVCDGNVGTSGSDLNLSTTTVTSGVPVSVTSATFTEGNA